MMKKKLIILTLCLAMMSAGASAGIADLPQREVNGRQCHYYIVQPHETLYSLCKKLDISRDEILRHNPDLVDGLKAGQELLFPVGGAPVVAKAKETGASASTTYEVQKGDTAYGISVRHGISVDEFYRLNPEAHDGLRTGQIVKLAGAPTVSPAQEESAAPVQMQPTIAVTPSTAAPAVTAPEATGGAVPYTIGEGETLYRIAKNHNTSVAQLLEMNPNIDVATYGAGTVIMIPAAGGAVVEEVNRPDDNMLTKPDDNMLTPVEPAIVEVTAPDTISIAVALPFMLDVQPRSKHAKLYTEFYKGLLLAVDSMKDCGKPLKVMAYDVATDAGFDNMLADQALKNANVVIASDNLRQLSQLGEFGHRYGVNILNIFDTKDMGYVSNSRMMQANIPHTMMYEKALDYLMATYPGHTPVILQRNEGPNDKSTFTDAIRERASQDGRRCITVTYDGSLKESDLADIDRGGSYLFIPVSSKQAEINKVLPALDNLSQQATVAGSDVHLFGYPEWTIFRGETLANMHKVGTTVFSRFYTDADDNAFTDFNELMLREYGHKMAAVTPRQGLMGFETGMYLIQSLLNNGGDFDRYTPLYEGRQNSFDFVRSNAVGGRYNESLYIINYQPDNSIATITL